MGRLGRYAGKAVICFISAHEPLMRGPGMTARLSSASLSSLVVCSVPSSRSTPLEAGALLARLMSFLRLGRIDGLDGVVPQRATAEGFSRGSCLTRFVSASVKSVASLGNASATCLGDVLRFLLSFELSVTSSSAMTIGEVARTPGSFLLPVRTVAVRGVWDKSLSVGAP
jgi:hypothetical protein